MAKRNTSIHINGNQYDALTGNLLDDPIVPRKTVRSIDGVSAARVQPVASIAMPAKALPASQVPRARAAHAKTHPAKPSATLMRHAVTKPTSATLKRRAKVQTPTHHPSRLAAVTHVAVIPKASAHRVSPSRLARASAATTSPRVARFSRELALVEQTVHAIDQAFVIPETVTPTIMYRADVSTANSKTSDIFEQALRRATSHEQPAPETPMLKKSRLRAARSLRRRMVSYGAGAMAVLAIVGLLSFKSADTVKFRLAARDAGFSATMPNYHPQGFAVKSVRTVGGYVSVSYVKINGSTNSANTYAVTQKPTSWNSQELLSNILNANSDTAYNTVQQGGRTVYIYGRNQAAWIDKGILYQVLGNGALGTQDFGEIAASM